MEPLVVLPSTINRHPPPKRGSRYFFLWTVEDSGIPAFAGMTAAGTHSLPTIVPVLFCLGLALKGS